VPSVLIPRNPPPLRASADISLGNVDSFKTGVPPQEISGDDRRAVLDAILDADALIFATPIYSHQPPGFLKAVTDRILGPFTDAAFVERVLERKRAGDPKFKDQVIDDRVLKPRVVGFLVVGGSSYIDHLTMALPTLHQFVYPIQAKVVDQVVFAGYARPGAVIFKDGGQCVERAKLLGRNVASQLGKTFDEAAYLGPEPEGSCPFCHLAKIDYFGGPDNKIMPNWTADPQWSCITMEGKRLHADHIQEAGAAEAKAVEDFSVSKLEAAKKDLLDIDIPLLPLPSAKSAQSPYQRARFGLCAVM
jgi:multimeric flavodoxin WrbA